MSLKGHPVRIALLGATFETSNLGVSALTAGALTCLHESFPQADTYLLDYGREGRTYRLHLGNDRQAAVRLVNLRFSKTFWLSNNIAWLILLALILRLLPFAFLRNALLRRNAWLREMEETDLFVAISGGDSFSDIYGLGRLMYVALPQVLVLLLRKRLVLLPQTLGPYKSRIATNVAKFILNRAESVYSRDHAGMELARKLLKPGSDPEKVRFCNDVAFVMSPRKPVSTDISGLEGTGPLVGLNISGLLAMGGYTGRNMFGLRTDYNHLVGRMIEFLVEVKGARVLLVPHVFGKHEESDVVVCEKTYEGLIQKYPGRLGYLRGVYDQHEIKHIISGCDFFIGSRMHSCIAAISQAVPAVAVAYSDKFRGVMDTVGMGKMVADPRTMSEEDILRLVDRAFEHRTEIHRELQAKIPSIQVAVLGLFKSMMDEQLVTSSNREQFLHTSTVMSRD